MHCRYEFISGLGCAVQINSTKAAGIARAGVRPTQAKAQSLSASSLTGLAPQICCERPRAGGRRKPTSSTHEARIVAPREPADPAMHLSHPASPSSCHHEQPPMRPPRSRRGAEPFHRGLRAGALALVHINMSFVHRGIPVPLAQEQNRCRRGWFVV